LQRDGVNRCDAIGDEVSRTQFCDRKNRGFDKNRSNSTSNVGIGVLDHQLCAGAMHESAAAQEQMLQGRVANSSTCHM
jgi:hypothetical protein